MIFSTGRAESVEWLALGETGRQLGIPHVQGGRSEKEARQTEGPSSLAPLGGSFFITTTARRNLQGLPCG